MVFEFSEQGSQDFDEHIWKRVPLEILAVEVDRTRFRSELLCGVVKQQRFSATPSRKDGVILACAYVL
jgi:hypothetical protein